MSLQLYKKRYNKTMFVGCKIAMYRLLQPNLFVLKTDTKQYHLYFKYKLS